MQPDYHRKFIILHRMISMVSGATKFTEETRHQQLITVIFLDFIYSCIRSYKINKSNKLATKINSTGRYAKVMDVKSLPELRNGLIMFQKNYQVLFLSDHLLLHLTLNELAY